MNSAVIDKYIQFLVMGVKGRRVHMIEEMSDTIISFQRGISFFANVNLPLPISSNKVFFPLIFIFIIFILLRRLLEFILRFTNNVNRLPLIT